MCVAGVIQRRTQMLWSCVDVRSKQVIRDAVMDNNFLKNLDTTQVREIVDCVYERRVKTGQFVIKEGDPGQHFYVAAGQSHRIVSPAIYLCNQR